MVTDGPACSADAAAVLTNKPAPIIAPIPRATNPGAVSVFFNPFSYKTKIRKLIIPKIKGPI